MGQGGEGDPRQEGAIRHGKDDGAGRQVHKVPYALRSKECGRWLPGRGLPALHGLIAPKDMDGRHAAEDTEESDEHDVAGQRSLHWRKGRPTLDPQADWSRPGSLRANYPSTQQQAEPLSRVMASRGSKKGRRERTGPVQTFVRLTVCRCMTPMRRPTAAREP